MPAALDAIDPNTAPLPDFAAVVVQTGMVDRLLELARDEDLGVPARDLTGELVFEPRARRRLRLVAREPGVAAGLAFIPRVVAVFAGGAEPVSFSLSVDDGAGFGPGTTLAKFEGSARALARLERTLLNLTARLCGVATRTAAFVRAVEGTGVSVCDTRKTTPGLRLPEKYAVRCGGGLCHRLGLHDAVLVKDNHIAGLGDEGFSAELARVATGARSGLTRPRFVQVEVDTLEQLDRVLALPAGLIDMVLLDNMSPSSLAEGVTRRDGRSPGLLLEASGGITLETARSIARTGVDRLSVGALTHAAVSLDLGLDAV